jgi:hypothetical protein
MTRSIDLNEIARKYQQATEGRDNPSIPAVLDREGKLAAPGTVSPDEASQIPTSPFAQDPPTWRSRS